MKKRCGAIFLLFAFALSLCACGSAPSPSETPRQRSLRIVWPTLDIDFYSAMAEGMQRQAEAAGWNNERPHCQTGPNRQAEIHHPAGAE